MGGVPENRAALCVGRGRVGELSWASLVAQLVKNPPVMQETPVRFLGREDRWRTDRLPTPIFLGFPCGSTGKESAMQEI